MKIDNLYLVTLFGEGYYSGNTREESALITEELYEEFKDEIMNYTPYFSYLDGKHSEVEGITRVRQVCKEDLPVIISMMLEGDYFYVLDHLVDNHLKPKEDTCKFYELNQDFLKLCKVETKTEYYFNGEKL